MERGRKKVKEKGGRGKEKKEKRQEKGEKEENGDEAISIHIAGYATARIYHCPKKFLTLIVNNYC